MAEYLWDCANHIKMSTTKFYWNKRDKMISQVKHTQYFCRRVDKYHMKDNLKNMTPHVLCSAANFNPHTCPTNSYLFQIISDSRIIGLRIM